MKVRVILICIIMLMLSSCATQHNVQLSDNFWRNKKQNIVVATTKAPKPGVYHGGSQGFIDYAIVDSMNNKIDTSLAKADLKWYEKLPHVFSSQLQQRHIIARSYDSQLDRDSEYPAMFAQTNSEKLLVIRLKTIGAIRNYYGFIPISDPKAYCVLTGELINAKNNQVLWRQSTTISEPIEGEWDQPPNYPNLHHALQLAVASAQEELMASFFSGH